MNKRQKSVYKLLVRGLQPLEIAEKEGISHVYARLLAISIYKHHKVKNQVGLLSKLLRKKKDARNS